MLTVTQMLRKRRGRQIRRVLRPGLDHLPLADRATRSVPPEYGATCGFFPVDQITIDYLRLTGRNEERIARRGLQQGSGHVA